MKQSSPSEKESASEPSRGGIDIRGGEVRAERDIVAGDKVQHGFTATQVLFLVLGVGGLLLVAIFLVFALNRTDNTLPGAATPTMFIAVATPSPQATVAQTTCLPSAQFVSDVNSAGELAVNPNTLVDKIWSVKNNGVCAWGGEVYELVQTDGATIELVDYEIPRIEASNSGTILLRVRAPKENGAYWSTWRLRIIDGNVFGEPLYLNLRVRGVESPTPPRSTATPPVVSVERRGADNAEMVFVPAGIFSMGSEQGARNERPAHPIELAAFWIDQHEVTNGQYKECERAGVCSAPYLATSKTRDGYYWDDQFENFPVIYVAWHQAREYCDWAGKRLPTEAEWEKAARGTDERIYPWGNEFDPERIHIDQNMPDTTEVGKFPRGASPYGALDMAANVLEWVNDAYDEEYYSISPSVNPTGPLIGNSRVIRGGTWNSPQSSMRTSTRREGKPFDPGYNLGFRCAQSAAPATATPTPIQATPTLLAAAPSLIINYVISPDQLTPTEMELDNSLVNLGPNAAAEFMRVTRAAYGELDDTRYAFEIRVRVKNPTNAPIRLQVDPKFFSLEDLAGEKANLLYFCCATPEAFLGAGSEREIQFVFQAPPDWSGKSGESVAYFRVKGYLPILRAAWPIPLPVTAE